MSKTYFEIWTVYVLYPSPTLHYKLQYTLSHLGDQKLMTHLAFIGLCPIKNNVLPTRRKKMNGLADLPHIYVVHASTLKQKRYYKDN